MIRIFFILIFCSFFFLGCKNQEMGISRIEGQQLNINESLPENEAIEKFIAPYRQRIAREMDSVLAFAPIELDKTKGDLNTAIGNMMADAVMELADPIFRKRTGKNIDVVLLNFGGIRSTINKGNITTRTAYQIMPFENEVVVAELRGEQLMEMIDYLGMANTAHPIAGMQLELKDGKIIKAMVQGKPVVLEETYNVATNDYLFTGGDNMEFFTRSQNETYLDYKLRNLLIDYFRKKDTIAPVIDQRFTRK